MVTRNKYEKAVRIVKEYEERERKRKERRDLEIDEAILKLSKGDYLHYSGGSMSEYFIKGDFYRLTGQPYKHRVNVINSKGVRVNTNMRFFTV
tara:strand:- start:1279 stop:1557 length:279 start_codon:yes stop_codon:yes gene_type:complete